MESKDLTMARAVARKVEMLGGRTFFVGGYVRDRLMKRENKDVDVEVHGIYPQQLEQILEELGGCTKKGVSFGVYGIRGCGLDIAMPRMEKATGRGHRDFQVYVDPFLGTEKAARRRDFTINAMMEDVLNGEIIDDFGGRRDLEQGLLRHVDKDSFREDPLRALRAAQFAARFQFRIEPQTLKLCADMDLTALAGERIMGELEKALLKAEHPSIFFQALEEMEQLDDWFPEVKQLIGVEQSSLYHPEGDVWNHTMLVLDEAATWRGGAVIKLKQSERQSAGQSTEQSAGHSARQRTLKLQPENTFGFMLAALCHDFGKVIATESIDGQLHAYSHEVLGLPMVSTFLGRLTRNKRLTAYVLNLVKLHMKPNIMAGERPKMKSTNRLFDSAVDPEGLILLARADYLGSPGREILEENEGFLGSRLLAYRQMMSRPWFKGEDLIQAGITPGPEVSQGLEYGHKLRLAGIDKENGLKQTLAYMRKGK